MQVIYSSVKAVVTGAYHSMVLRQDGSVWGTGSNGFGQLGMDLRLVYDENHLRFYRVIARDVKAVAAGAFHSLVLMQNGSVWATGRNMFGQLGDGSRETQTAFTEVVTDGAHAVAAGHSHSIILSQDSSVWAAGSNVHGQLGDGTSTERHEFVKVKCSNGKRTQLLSGVVHIAGGFRHSMVVTEDGSVLATGSNLSGQFGDGTMNSQDVFTKVAQISDKVGPDATVKGRHPAMTTRAFEGGESAPLSIF